MQLRGNCQRISHNLCHKWKHDFPKVRQDNVLTTPNPRGIDMKTLHCQFALKQRKSWISMGLAAYGTCSQGDHYLL